MEKASFLLLERTTRLELATSTLARWRSTRWATSADHTVCSRRLLYYMHFPTFCQAENKKNFKSISCLIFYTSFAIAQDWRYSVFLLFFGTIPPSHQTVEKICSLIHLKGKKRLLKTLIVLRSLPGASDRNRTNDTGIFSPLLYQLSYRGKYGDPERARTVDL